MPDTTIEIRNSHDSIDLMGLLTILAKRRKTVITTVVFAAVVSVTTSLMMTPVFTSTARIMPPQQQSGAAALLGSLGGSIGTLAGGMGGLKNPNDLYVGMLQSQTVTDNLIKRFDLKNRYDVGTMVDASKVLLSTATIVSGKDSLISISVDDEDPKFSAALANAFVDELIKLTNTLALTESAQRRMFFEKRMVQTKEDLAAAEVKLKQVQENTGMLQLDEQVTAIINSAAQLKAQIAIKEVQLTSMKSFATKENPDYIRAEQELAGMKAQLSKIESSNNTANGTDFMIPTGKIPESGLEYVRKLRDVKYHETMFEMLAKQYELARLDEAKDSGIVQVLDIAKPSDKKSRPKRGLIVILGIIAGFIGGLGLAFIQEAIQNSKKDNPENWRVLRTAWHRQKA
ncbi:GumC family protein [Vogesella indigofera]|uniref:GumC family protein n=1 Tax=Vogesella indigofera TaxID=45465 RepID=UPI003F42FCFC